MRSDVTAGEAFDRPGKSVVQTMFLPVPHSDGRFVSSETPRPAAPRQAGHVSAAQIDATIKHNTVEPAAIRLVSITIFLLMLDAESRKLYIGECLKAKVTPSTENQS